MKVLMFLGLCLVASASAEDKPNVDLPSLPSKVEIIEILKKFDPLHKEVLSLKLPNANTTFEPFELALKNLDLTGVGGADPNLKLQLVFLPSPTKAKDIGYKITFKLDFKEYLKASADYTLSGKLVGALDLHGKGTINANIEGLVVELMVQLRTTQPNNYVAFDDFHVTARMGDKTTTQVTGLFNNEEISKAISEVLPKIIERTFEDHEADINVYLKPKIQKLYVDTFEDVTIDELAEKINNILHPTAPPALATKD